jgi:flavin-dependent dehydrogenase
MISKKKVLIAGGGPAGNLFCILFSRLGWEITQARSDWTPPQRKHVHYLKKRILDISKNIDERLYKLVLSSVENNYENLQDGSPIFWLNQSKLVNGLEYLACKISSEANFSIDDLTNEIADSYDIMIDATGSRMKLARQCEKIGIGHLVVDDTGNFNQYTTNIFYHKNAHGWVWIDKIEDAIVYGEAIDGVLKITTDAIDLNPDKLPKFIHKFINSNPVETYRCAAPKIRRSNWQGNSLVRVGDALVQLPAQTGFGFTSIFEQGLICSSLAPDKMEYALNDFADKLWMGTVTQFAMKQHFNFNL